MPFTQPRGLRGAWLFLWDTPNRGCKEGAERLRFSGLRAHTAMRSTSKAASVMVNMPDTSRATVWAPCGVQATAQEITAAGQTRLHGHKTRMGGPSGRPRLSRLSCQIVPLAATKRSAAASASAKVLNGPSIFLRVTAFATSNLSLGRLRIITSPCLIINDLGVAAIHRRGWA